MSAQGSVLVVDDDEDIRLALAECVEYLGYRVDTAENGLDALALLERSQSPPILILLDMMMPVMDGRAFLTEIRKHAAFAAIPVVICSAHGNPGEVAAQVNAAGHLRKPLRLDDLARAIEHASAAA